MDTPNRWHDLDDEAFDAEFERIADDLLARGVPSTEMGDELERLGIGAEIRRRTGLSERRRWWQRGWEIAHRWIGLAGKRQ